MKNKILLLTLLSISTVSFSQDNTLPTSGNVGIGTLNPSSKLDVNGSMIIDSTLLIKDSLRVNKDIRTMGRLFVEDKVVMKNDAIVRQNLKVNGNSRVIGNQKIEGLLKLPNTNALPTGLYNSGSYDLLTLNPNGNVTKLSFAKLLGGLNPNTSDGCELNGVNRTNPLWFNGQDKIYTYCPEINVGIGFTNPRVNLDVNGRGYMKRIYLGVTDPTIANNNLYFHLKAPFSSTISDRTLFIVENGDRKLFEIHNNGLIRAREIKIDALTWADYVFENNYPLLPLNELENYIAINGHLPNVPSAAEVKEEGINLAEMNAVLLEKIEELTLYLIEQEKRIVILESNQTK